MTRDPTTALRDMLEHGDLVRDFIAGIDLASFLSDPKTQFAVIRALEVIGEAARKVPDEVRDRHPEIPWRQIVAMRNILAHDYLGVRAETVFETAVVFVPELVAALSRVLGR